MPEAQPIKKASPGHGLPWALAAPSCVLPAGVAENCAFLARHFDEIGLAFFETEACLAYTEADLPLRLAQLPVSWHMHLPLDLPLELPEVPHGPGGAQAAARAVLALRQRAGHLAPGRFVLHPPPDPAQLALLARLLEQGGLPPQALLVENIAGRDLALHWPVIQDLGLGVCLDLGHMLAHGQQGFLALPGLWERVGMLHLNAPDPLRPGRHAALTQLDAAGRALCLLLLERLAPGGVVMLELFSEDALFESLAWLRAHCAGPGRKQEALA